MDLPVSSALKKFFPYFMKHSPLFYPVITAAALLTPSLCVQADDADIQQQFAVMQQQMLLLQNQLQAQQAAQNKQVAALQAQFESRYAQQQDTITQLQAQLQQTPPKQPAPAELEAGLPALPLTHAPLITTAPKTTTQAAMPTSFDAPSVSFGGQYRINAYMGDDGIEGSHTAGRARLRQSLDIQFTEHFKTHLQAELGHTTDNMMTTTGSDRKTNLSARHAVMDYTFDNKINMQAGLLPLTDYFGDTLFSSDWDYNPLALAMTAPLGQGTVRAFAATLREMNERNNNDDVTHYQLDYILPWAQHRFNVGASVVTLPNSQGESRFSANYGIGGQWFWDQKTRLNTFILGSYSEQGLISQEAASGVAAKLELIRDLPFGSLGAMATHASGHREGRGFIPVMALSGVNGYWGYTGFLTVQGFTDTGLGDSDGINFANNGYGMTSLQTKYTFPITQKLDGYLGAGWFGNTSAQGRRSDVGYDVLLMGSYHFNRYLSLNFGGAYAYITDSLSPYYNRGDSFGVVGGGVFRQDIGEYRHKQMLFTRLQAEF